MNSTTFRPPPSRSATATSSTRVQIRTDQGLTELDGRGSAPPQRVPAILAALQTIPPGAVQCLRTKECPLELLHALGRHGIETDAMKLPDGTWRSRLRVRLT